MKLKKILKIENSKDKLLKMWADVIPTKSFDYKPHEVIARKNDLLKQAAIALKQTGTCKAIVAAIEEELNVE